MRYLLQRLAEPSSAAGLGAIISGVAGAMVGTTSWPTAVPAIMGGVMAFLMREKGAA